MSEIARFAPLVDEHFDDEENKVVPIIAEYLGPKEWRKFLSHGSAFVRAHPRRGLALGGIVLDGLSAETRERFLGYCHCPCDRSSRQSVTAYTRDTGRRFTGRISRSDVATGQRRDACWGRYPLG